MSELAMPRVRDKWIIIPGLALVAWGAWLLRPHKHVIGHPPFPYQIEEYDRCALAGGAGVVRLYELNGGAFGDWVWSVTYQKRWFLLEREFMLFTQGEIYFADAARAEESLSCDGDSVTITSEYQTVELSLARIQSELVRSPVYVSQGKEVPRNNIRIRYDRLVWRGIVLYVGLAFLSLPLIDYWQSRRRTG
jgi:hypothetical protein